MTLLTPPPPLRSIAVSPQPAPDEDCTWWAIARRRSVVIRALKTSLFVGTILVGINHGDALLRRDCPPDRWLKIGLTYLVPYSVATFASVSTLRDLMRTDRRPQT